MKDKNVAGILALFFGWLGIHRFYLGQVGLGILYALLFWSGISVVLGLIDAIVFFSMDKDAFDIKYNRQFYRAERKRDTDFDRRQNYRDRWENRENRENRRDFREERRERRYPENRYSQQRPASNQPPAQQSPMPKLNPFKTSGIKKYKEYDYDGAIADFLKALEVDPKDIAVHFNLACAYSLNENTERALYHLSQAVRYGFNDFRRIKEHDALAFLRIQPEFEDFEKNNYILGATAENPPATAEEEELQLDGSPSLLDQLKKLGELREKGLLTDEEFASQKKKLLDQ